MNYVIGNLSNDILIMVESLPLPNKDVIVLEKLQLPGGAAGNVSATLAKFNNEVSIISALGEDNYSIILNQDMISYGINTSCLMHHSGNSSEFLVIMDKKGNRCFFLDENISIDWLKDFNYNHLKITKNDSISFVGCTIQTGFNFLQHYNDSRILKFVNLGFWISSGEIGLIDYSHLNSFDLIFLNRDEFLMLPTKLRYSLTSRKFLIDNRQLIVTNGSKETVVFTSNGKNKAFPTRLDSVINTLGCGDAFMGAYIHCYLRNISVEESIHISHFWAGKVAKIKNERALNLSTNDIPYRII
jgi:sugar/nucleoside kinase (ribokinase family)